MRKATSSIVAARDHENELKTRLCKMENICLAKTYPIRFASRVLLDTRIRICISGASALITNLHDHLHLQYSHPNTDMLLSQATSTSASTSSPTERSYGYMQT